MKRQSFYLIVIFFLAVTGIYAGTAKPDSLRIAFLTDIHVNPQAPSEKALLEIITEINTDFFDFVLITGDLTNTGSDKELTTVKRALEKLERPYYVIPGNHETNWSESAGASYKKLFGADRFWFEKGEYLFAGFSTGPYMKMGDGHVKEEDLHWLRQTLEQKIKPDKTLLIASHYPLADGLDNWYKVTGLLKKYKPGLVFCGHGHRLTLLNFDGITGLMGRPTFYAKDSIGGYNIAVLKNDSAHIFEKKIGKKARSFVSFSLKNNDIIKDLPLTPHPIFSSSNEVFVNQGNASSFTSLESEEIIQDSASIFTGAVIFENLVIYGNSKGEVIAYEYPTKKIKWKKQLEGSLYATPTVTGKEVIIGDLTGIHVFEANSGKAIRFVPLDGPVIGDAATDGNSVYQSAGNKLYKINITSGAIDWVFNANGQLQGKPAADKHSLVFGAWDRHLYCLDKNSGKLLWKWDNGHSAVLYSPGNVAPAISGDKVFIVAPDRYMTAIDLKTGQTVWRTNQYKVRESMGISEDGKTVYAKLMNDSVIAVSTNTGSFKEEWIVNAGFGYEHNPCPLLEHRGIVYAGGKNGLLVAIDSRNRQLIFRSKLGNSSINKIIPDRNGTIWVSLIEGKIIRIDYRK